MLYDDIISKINDIKNLNFSLSLLHWDQSTYITKNGVNSRSEVIETITKICHDKIISDELYEKIVKLADSNELNTLDEINKKEILKIKTDVDKARKIPTKLAGEIAKTTAVAMSVWQNAKKANDDKDFLPILKEVFKLKKEYANIIGFDENIYDALLDDFDNGLKYSYIKDVFEKLEVELVRFLNKIKSSKTIINNDFLFKKFDTKKQWEFGLYILNKMGLNPDSFRQDTSMHPFTVTIGDQDVRITTDIKENNFIKGFFSTIHEGGHCLYELGVNNYLRGSYFANITSLSMHESQSRFYENIIARSFEFWKYYYSHLQSVFKENLADIPLMDFYKAINKITNNPIRVESDEATYNLHIILRTQLENDILNEKINIDNIEEAWNEKTKKIFGFYPKSKAEGYLQDIHWSDGLIGYFPTYTLGNLISCQFNKNMNKDINKEYEINDEKLNSIYHWLNKKIYTYGSMFTSVKMVKMATGESLNHNYFIDYLNNKFLNIY